MLKRLRAVNFLSLQDLELNLGLTNVFVGPNMAGKSNIFECLKFLTSIATSGLIKAMIGRNGFPEVVWKGPSGNHKISISFSGETKTLERESSYDYELTILVSQTGFTSIEYEHLSATVNGRRSVLAEMKNGQGSINRLDGTKVADTTGSPVSSILELAMPGWEGFAFKNYVASWRYYKLSPIVMKQANAAVLQSFLQEHG